MSNINIQVEDQTLYVTNAPKIAAQGIKENYVVFSFSSDWDGFGKSALFYRLEDEDTVYESVVDNTGKAVVPYEVTQKDGKICLGVCGVKNDVVKTSEIIKYKIVKGRYTSGEESQPPTPGIYEQMLALAGSISDQVNNAPYVEYEEDGEYALPVHTINDNEETTSNTWSAQKIKSEIGSAFTNKLKIKTFRLEADTSIGGENFGSLYFKCADTDINTILAIRGFQLALTAFATSSPFTMDKLFISNGMIRADITNYNSSSITFSMIGSSVQALVLAD